MGRIDEYKNKKIPLYLETEGARLTKETYREKYEQGFTFYSNKRVKDVQAQVMKCGGQGLEVFVGEKSFRIDGSIDPDARAILVRKKRN